MHRFLTVVIISLIALINFSVSATNLTGKITVSKKFIEQLDQLRKDSESSTARGYWNEPNGVRPLASERVDLPSDIGVAIFREGAPEPEADPVLSLNVLTGSLERNVVIIRPKSRIKFIMKSPFDHELYAAGKHDFKPQKQGSNSFRPIDFYSAGVFEVRCKLFPHFQGWIVATPATYVPEISSSGAFAVEDMEEGKYTLKVFFRGRWIVEKKFEVSGKKQEIAVTLKKMDGAPDDDSAADEETDTAEKTDETAEKKETNN
jgi:hypothetical protein